MPSSRYAPQHDGSQSNGFNFRALRGIGVVELIRYVLVGKLLAFHLDRSIKPLSDLSFREADILGLTQHFKSEQGWMSFVECVALLNVNRVVLHALIARKLLVPVASLAGAQYFNRDCILELRDRLMTSNEVAQLLQSTRAAVSYWVRNGYLEPLIGSRPYDHHEFIFDREQVERWHEKYITTREVKALLKATDPQLHFWRKQGKLTRLVTGSKTPSFYSRNEVLSLRTQILVEYPEPAS